MNHYSCRFSDRSIFLGIHIPLETIKFDKVLLISDKKDTQIGKPFIENSIVEGKIKEHYRDKKISIIKFKRRKHYSRIAGHRQNMTRIEITKIG